MTTHGTRTAGGDAVAAPRAAHGVVSPVTGGVLDRVELASKSDLVQAVARLSRAPEGGSVREVFDFLGRLKDQLLRERDRLFEKTMLETGFIARDAMEAVDGAVEFLTDFEVHVREQSERKQVIRHSYSSGSHRNMRITDRPIGCVAAVVPQNASLTLGITIIAAALHAGCRVLLRPSLQCGSSGELLAELVTRSRPPENSVEIVNCLASDFIAVCCESEEVDLIHYIGSNRYALPVFEKAFSAGKICLLDGQGHGLVYLDETYPIGDAVEIIASGATRFNGETCTSINGALIAEVIYDRVRDALLETFRELRVGNPGDRGVQIGPLFSPRQAAELRQALLDTPGGRIICGGETDGAYFRPALLEGVQLDHQVVREGFFGPALWLRPVREGDLWPWIRGNQFPLSDTILSRRRDIVTTFARNSRAARICVNQDPSDESMFEPWGGYPPSGLNPVSIWTEKYRRTFQLDGQLNEILTIPSDARNQGP